LPSPDGWTESHPDWQKSWLSPLVFPPTGKNRATVDKIDIPRLDEREFLNDNLINFYIRYLEYKLEKERPELLRKVYFFSTFFFEKLKSTKGRINYEGVKAWTAKVDLLSYDYIFVPVNEHAHWYLAIICNVPNAIQSSASEEKNTDTSTTTIHNAIEMIDAPGSPRMSTVERDLTDVSLEDVAAAARKEVNDLSSSHGTAPLSVPPSPTRKRKSAAAMPSKFDPTQPRIITLDSLGGPHAPTCKALKEYLVEEARTKKGIALATIPTGMTARGIPEQNNFCDCGVFVLGYMQEFLTNPDEAARKLLLKEELGWNIRPSELRNHIRGLLFDLQVEQQKQHQQLQEEKKLRKAKKKSMAETSTQIHSSPKPVASSSPAPKLPGTFPSESPERKPMSGAESSSSESVQEADNLKDNNLNGEILLQDEQRFKALAEPRFISCLSDASSPSPNIVTEKIPPITSSKAPEEPQFFSCLSDGGGISPNIAKGKIPPIDSSPTSKHGGYSSKLVVELKSLHNGYKSQFEESALADDEADVQIVKQQSSSSSENEVRLKSTETHRSRQSSVELIGATKSRPTSSQMHDQRTKSSASISPRLRVQQSIESDVDRGGQEGPKYDGIDRSADGTMS
jgi:sentrin-specific protease 7